MDSGKVDQQTAADLLTEANELVAIAISSINTAKRNSGAKQSPRLIGKLWAGRIMHYALCILHLNRSRPRPFQQRTNTSCYLAIPTHGFTVVLSVFRGTPPAKPLKCKSVSNRLGARFRQRWTESTGGKPRLSCPSSVAKARRPNSAWSRSAFTSRSSSTELLRRVDA